jgi:hypothetical protein
MLLLLGPPLSDLDPPEERGVIEPPAPGSGPPPHTQVLKVASIRQI